jgi:hypothetical protein
VRRTAPRASAYREFEIHSGRRTIATQFSSSALQAAIDYVRALGSSINEIRVHGPATVSSRGARFLAVVLDITAESGPGNLLGNLLCGIAGLLDQGNTPLNQLVNLLNQLLQLL